ncbi:beta-hydroxyacyl-ACP dehydratase [Stutzerimonas xanthomarina]|uniref:beta-hydroxyacyl-ACP dehydratase n=1 Tax=Stutzerimonas xanthomarina TaxID=271420 RepID=UPI0029B3CA69|nr:beta-hydroxyacyl-ACP dehydratase [Stutzerimonas xanthomarina]MDX2353056.1 beta-hydroxyacyl-ACP dehydratase [Stutzerimonas xanthomarina]
MDRTRLLSLLPHQGPALWLDRVLEHDATDICGLTAWSYLEPFGADASPCLLFEAAAQLCGAHGALYGADKSIETALVAKLSAVQLHHEPVERRGALQVRARQETLSPAGALYAFSIYSHDRLLVDGRLLLVLTHA